MTQDRIQQVADVATHGGAAIAGASFLSLGWWNENSAAIVAFCALGGLVVSAIGLGVGIIHKRKMREQMRQQ